MSNLGRYIIDNPEPPEALEQLRGNIGMLGQTAIQLKMAELERKRKREDELSLLREKAKIEQESPIFRLGMKEKVASTAKAMDSTIPEAASYLGVNYQDLFGAEEPSFQRKQEIRLPMMDVTPNLSGGITTQKPVFGNLIPETYESRMNRITGQSTVEPKTFLNPETEKQKNILKEDAPLAAESGRIYSGALQGVRDIRQISDILGLTSGQINPKAKELIYKANLSIEGGGAKQTIIPFGQGVYRGAKLLRGGDEGAKLGNLFMTLSENLLRARTGAQAPDPEVVREHARTLLRGFIESPETWINKLKQNEEFLLGTAQQVKPTKWKQDLEEYKSSVFENLLEFSSEAEAEAANLPDGTPITINGVKGKWRNE